MYTALLRLPKSATREEKDAEVTRIINLLRLQRCADTPIFLISGGEKKRVNIGTELLTNPEVILLDEPTSGLDSTSAVSLLRSLHTLANENGKTIITSIHQPSSAVFRSFDKLIMLAEGHVVYYGTPIASLSYLKERGLSCPDGYNAADHWMDLLVNDSAIQDEDDLKEIVPGSTLEEKKDEEKVEKPRQLLIESWDDSAQAAEVMENINHDLLSNGNQSFLLHDGKKFSTTWMTQFLVLMHRAMRNSRAAVFTMLNLVKSAVIGVLTGLLWYQQPYTELHVFDRQGYFFFTMSYWVFESMFNAFMTFPMERDIIFKERASGSYHLSAYFLAKTISEVPTRLFLPIIYMVFSYWMAGVNDDFGIFVGTTFVCLLCVLTGESYGLLIGASVLDMEKGMVVMVVFALCFLVLGGYFVAQVPIFLDWIKYTSPFKYSYEATRRLVFNKDTPCDGSGLLEPCLGSDEGFVTPEQMAEILNFEGSIGFNIGMLIVLFIVPRYLAYVALKRHRGGERI